MIFYKQQQLIQNINFKRNFMKRERVIFVLSILGGIFFSVIGQQDLCMRLNKRLQQIKQEFKDSDTELIEKYRIELQKRLEAAQFHHDQAQEELANPQAFVAEYRKLLQGFLGNPESMISFFQEKLQQPDEETLIGIKERLQHQITSQTNLLHNNYYDQLVLPSDEQKLNEKNTEWIEKHLKETQQLQLLPDAELLQHARKEFQDSIKEMENAMEERKRDLAKTDKELFAQESKKLAESVQFWNKAIAHFKKILRSSQLILEYAKKERMLKFSQGVNEATQRGCPVRF